MTRKLRIVAGSGPYLRIGVIALAVVALLGIALGLLAERHVAHTETLPALIRSWWYGDSPRPDAADDLCQKTFLKLHIGRHRYQPLAPFRYWIFTIARNVLRDEARERRRKPTTDLGALDRHGNTAVESSRHDTMDVGLMVTEALAALPLGQREVIVGIEHPLG